MYESKGTVVSMRKITILLFFFLLFGIIFFQKPVLATVDETEDKFSLWKYPSYFRGAAIHPYAPYGEKEDRTYHTKDDFQSLRDNGANVISLNYPGPFKSSPPYDKDDESLEFLDNAIDWAEEVGLFAIIHFRNGPGKPEDSFWGGEVKKDETIWVSRKARKKWIEMWQFVAERYKDRPHVIGYNLMVEPHPEDTIKQKAFDADVWIKLAKRITKAIRKVDAETPIIVSSSGWAGAWAFKDLKLTGDSRTIYSFHNYEPYEFTHQGLEWAEKGDSPEYSYPGVIPSDLFEEDRYWDRDVLEEIFQDVVEFQEENGVPIFVGSLAVTGRLKRV